MFQITGLSIVTQPFVQAQIKENTKAQRHWVCKGNSSVIGEFTAKRSSNAENVSIDDVIMCTLHLASFANDFS